jgi:hypothetical protein
MNIQIIVHIICAKPLQPILLLTDWYDIVQRRSLERTINMALVCEMIRLDTLSDDGLDDSGKDKGESSYESTSSPVVVGTWLAKSGDVGVALANVGLTTLPLRFDARLYGFKGGERISLIQEKGKKDFGTVGVDGQVSIEVPSREAYIIELLKK